MDLSSVPPATLQQWLTEAFAALHALSTGRREVTISNASGDVSRSVTYNQGNLAELRAWIATLQGALTGRTRRRAIGVRF